MKLQGIVFCLYGACIMNGSCLYLYFITNKVINSAGASTASFTRRLLF